MVKVKIKNNKITQHILEDNNLKSSDNNVIQGIKPLFTLNDNVMEILLANLNAKFEDNKSLIKIKLTKKFKDIIRFPDAPAMLDALMIAAQFPPKFFNVHKAIAADPSKTINDAPDFAIKAFTNTNWTINNETNDEGSNRIRTKRGQNESVNYLVNEASPLATTAGVVTGVAAGAYTLGVASVAFNSDHGVYVTNDSEYKKTYDTQRNISNLNSESLVEGIDYYLTNISKNISVLLRECTSPNNNKDIEDLLNTISSLSTSANTRIKLYLNDNNENLRKILDLQHRETENKLRDRESFARELKDTILQGMLDGKSISDLLRLLKVSTRILLERERKALGLLENSNFVNYEYSNYINEDYTTNLDDIELEPFNADTLYNEVRGSIREKIIKIMSSDPEEWTDIKWARQLMEQMKNDTDKEIKERIKLVCRMADSGQVGLSSKLASFVSKHPLRAEGLTGIWNRHMRDLDERIQRRIKHISTPESGSPISMAIEFLQETIPNVIAMMITYKTIALLLEDKRTLNKYVSADIEEKDKEVFLKNEVQDIIDILELLFTTYGHYLNKDDKPVYDISKHDFTNNSLDYLPIFMLKILDTKINSENIDVFTKIIKSMDAAKLSSVDLFFNTFILILTENNVINTITDFTIINKFKSIYNELQNILLAYVTGDYINKHINNMGVDNRSLFNYILARILASNGAVLKNFVLNRTKLLGIENDKHHSISKLLELDKIPEDKIAVWTNYCESLDLDKDINNVMSINNSYIKILNIYYKYKLYRCTEYHGTEKSDLFNIKTVAMFINMLASNVLSSNIKNMENITDLVHLNEVYNDPLEFYEAVHEFAHVPVNDKLNDFDAITNYSRELTIKLLDKNTDISQYFNNINNKVFDTTVFDNIRTISDIGNIIGLHIDTIEKFILSCSKQLLDNIKDKELLNKACTIFKGFLNGVLNTFDLKFLTFDLTKYNDFTEKENTINTGKIKLSFAQFCKNYKLVYDICNKSKNKNYTNLIILSLSTIETKINKAIHDALQSKYNMTFPNGFNLFGQNQILYNIGSNNNIDKNSYINAINKVVVHYNNIDNYVKSDINIKVILCNFLPVIFQMNTVKALINAIYNKK